jgi:Zn-dependent M28 family amino/carboxypeptidase
MATSSIMSGAGPGPDKDAKGNPTYYQEFRIGKLVTRNCLGMLEGSDAELKKEIVVLGAHYDHLGTADNPGPPFQRSDRPRDDDKIWNGADDNGSGTTTLLGLVKAFGEGGLKPKRSILFIAFSGEEGGLLGSYHYVGHPIESMARHVFMLNLDMVGRNPDKAMKIEGVGSAEGPRLRRTVEDAVAATGLKAVVNDAVTIQGGDSDHTPFREKGVPFVFFFSGFHADYHRVTDHADKLAYGNMVKVARTSGRILMTLADADETLAAKKLEFARPVPGAPRRTLGIGIEDVPDEDRESSA